MATSMRIRKSEGVIIYSQSPGPNQRLGSCIEILAYPFQGLFEVAAAALDKNLDRRPTSAFSTFKRSWREDLYPVAHSRTLSKVQILTARAADRPALRAIWERLTTSASHILFKQEADHQSLGSCLSLCFNSVLNDVDANANPSPLSSSI